MSPRALLLLAAVLALLGAGCLGVPPGAADTGDSVTILYTAHDLDTGAALRENRTATFTVGAGDSGLGLMVEKAVRGHRQNDTFSVVVRGDPSLDYSAPASVNRTLAPIPANQTAPTSDFTNYVGEPTLGKTFPAYGVYTGVVTAADNQTVTFNVVATDGQRDPVPSVGAVLVTQVTPTQLLRHLDPVNGSTFAVQPPSPFSPSTPLGLQPGSYKVLGATADKILYARSASTETDLIGKSLRVDVTVQQVTHVQATLPTGGDFGVRSSPQVHGDPSSVLGPSASPTS